MKVDDCIVDNLYRHKTNDFCCLWLSCEEVEADLPAGWVVTKLVKEVEGLPLEFLAGFWIPGDLDRILYLTRQLLALCS